ncbi:MAG TPA: T9SS type A sorting domain-containing protein [Flavobacteriales bacterium]|nr:T9SS type A sorting domain-containing protein [Flavobacteriales bacterium]HMR28447.1 T9SS type A sorting domain-containing protein [Flavobacteriales bacterium]
MRPGTLIAALLMGAMAMAQPYVPGQTYLSPNGHVEYRCGDLPLVISVPHGGALMPTDIPDRTCNSPVYDTDANTIQLGEAIDSVFAANEGCRPHLVICHLARRKLDANRNLADGACGDPQAEFAWQAFHAFIDSAKARVTADAGKGLYLDLHGHGHTVQRLELGYLLYEDELAFSDATLNTNTYINYSSIRNLALDNLLGLAHADLLRGSLALGTRLGAMGFPAVPSLQDPFPMPGEPYFSGGYNTARHSSYGGGTIDGLQVECHFTGVRDNAANRVRFADSLRVAVVAFLKDHYFGTAPGCATSVTEPDGAQALGLWPNPCGDRLVLDLPSGGVVSVVIHDLSGRAVLRQLSRGLVDVGRLSPGAYVLRVEGRPARSTFVKE